ncbi:MAG TPA: universal stress protein, partial [Sinorhizobium sp.]|nr:universal stress protein [Sinorhizobium sp.]
EGSPRERLERVTQAFEDWRLQSSGRKALALDDCRGDLAGCVRSECHKTGLVVAPAHGNMDARDAFHDVLFNEGKLVLVPPASGYSGDLLRHVVIGWKPHAHARGAVVAARRWLAVAERRTVLCVNDRPDGSYRFTARELLTQLGLEAEVVAIDAERRPVAEAILAFASTAHATCLLIGAYRHGYLMDLLLGRVTHHLLAHAELPLMMKH